MEDKFYITTAIVYTSAKPHIGNAYDVVLADTIARYKRQLGFDVHFLTGTDEHGEKIELKAKENNVSPKEYVDNIASGIRNIYDCLNISYDRFIRTTDEDHVAICQKIFQKLYDQGDIYKGEYEDWYCTPCESFFTESQLDENGCCPDCHRPVHKVKEEAYFFKMSKYQDRLIKYFEDNDFIRPLSRKKEMLNNFLLPGLKDLCVSRSSFTWGIQVPFDTKHVIYVWLDALVNYITGLGYSPDGESNELFKKYWPCDVHIIGKDIVRFHSIYWPIFLMALDIPLPHMIFGHPWLLAAPSNDDNDEGIKMSKSRGNVLYPDDLIKEFGVDGVRFYLLHEMPYDNDGLVNLKLFVERYNTDLANVLGNLVSRTVAMINKYHDGVIYDITTNYKEEETKDIKNLILDIFNTYFEKMEEYKVADSIDMIFDIFRRANKYIDETEPWVLAKDSANDDNLKMVLYNLACMICIGANFLIPFMPDTATAILDMFDAKEIDLMSYNNFNVLDNNTKITSTKVNLFVRKDLKEITI